MKAYAETHTTSPSCLLERPDAFAEGGPADIQVHPGSLLMDLPFTARAAGVARRTLAAALTGAAAQDMEEAELAVSELVTNGYQYGRAPLLLVVDWTVAGLDQLQVELTLTDGGCGEGPERRTAVALPVPSAEEGRGLPLVQALATDWSLDIGPDGSRAWCRLRLPLLMTATLSTTDEGIAQ